MTIKKGARPALPLSRHCEGSSVWLRHLEGLTDGQNCAFENKNVSIHFVAVCVWLTRPAAAVKKMRKRTAWI